MVVTRTVGPAAVGGMVALFALLAGCAPTAERAREAEPGLAGDLPLPDDAARQVGSLTATRNLLDDDGDGFVSPAEAEGYYRRHFEELDDNNDGRLSRAELRPEAPGTPDLTIADEELVGATEQDYVANNLRRYNQRADHTIGMMSTRDFDEMVGTSDPAISAPRREIVP